MTTVTTATRRSRRPLYALFVANGISVTGNIMAMVAIPWFVLVTTGSPSKTGIIAFFTILPTVLASFFGGTLVDRMGYRSMSVISDWASAVTMALIPLIHATTGIEFYQLIILVFVGALLDAPGTTARRSILPDLAEPAAMPLERATSINESVQRGASMAGAPLAGVLIALFSAPTVLWVNAASFVVSALLIVFAVPKAETTEDGEEEGAGYFAELAEGLRFIWSDGLMRTMIAIVMITNFLDGPLFAIFMPVYARDVVDSSVALGVMIGAFGAFGAFALLGALLRRGRPPAAPPSDVRHGVFADIRRAGDVCLPPSPVGDRPRNVGCRIHRGTDQSAYVDDQLPAYPGGDTRAGARRGDRRIVRRHSRWDAARRLRRGVVRAREECGWCGAGICRRRDRHRREPGVAHHGFRGRRNIRSDLLGAPAGAGIGPHSPAAP